LGGAQPLELFAQPLMILKNQLFFLNGNKIAKLKVFPPLTSTVHVKLISPLNALSIITDPILVGLSDIFF
jgi:hypothetical protein